MDAVAVDERAASVAVAPVVAGDDVLAASVELSGAPANSAILMCLSTAARPLHVAPKAFLKACSSF